MWLDEAAGRLMFQLFLRARHRVHLLSDSGGHHGAATHKQYLPYLDTLPHTHVRQRSPCVLIKRTRPVAFLLRSHFVLADLLKYTECCHHDDAFRYQAVV